MTNNTFKDICNNTLYHAKDKQMKQDNKNMNMMRAQNRRLFLRSVNPKTMKLQPISTASWETCRKTNVQPTSTAS